MDKLVSVLMCVYNTPVEFLSEAVNSILNQTYNALEYIIIDDHSDDEDTTDYLNSIISQDIRIRLIRNDSNLGLTASLVIGIKQCRGEYIARMDADDVSLPDRLEKQVVYMENNPGVALAGCDIMIISDTGLSEEINTERYITGDEVYRVNALFCHPGPAHPTFVFRRSFLTACGITYRRIIRKGQDYAIIADVLKHGGQIRKINEPLLKYRVHSEQISSSSGAEQLLYQSRTSYDYVRELFPELTEEECVAFSTLGWYTDDYVLLSKISLSDELQQACIHLIKHADCLNDPKLFITSVRKIIRINRVRNMFDPIVLEEELRTRLWKKAIRRFKESHQMWVIRPYIASSYRYAVKTRMVVR